LPPHLVCHDDPVTYEIRPDVGQRLLGLRMRFVLADCDEQNLFGFLQQWQRVAYSAAVSLALSLLAASASAQSPAAQRGLTFVRTHCAQCHAIDKASESPLTIAPPFRTLHLKYPIQSLERPLAEGIITNHPTMPQFRLEPDQIGDVIAYLKTLER
jgi:cytochrome c